MPYPIGAIGCIPAAIGCIPGAIPGPMEAMGAAPQPLGGTVGPGMMVGPGVMFDTGWGATLVLLSGMSGAGSRSVHERERESVCV